MKSRGDSSASRGAIRDLRLQFIIWIKPIWQAAKEIIVVFVCLLQPKVESETLQKTHGQRTKETRAIGDRKRKQTRHMTNILFREVVAQPKLNK